MMRKKAGQTTVSNQELDGKMFQKIGSALIAVWVKKISKW